MLISGVVIKLNKMIDEYGDLSVDSAELWGLYDGDEEKGDIIFRDYPDKGEF